MDTDERRTGAPRREEHSAGPQGAAASGRGGRSTAGPVVPGARTSDRSGSGVPWAPEQRPLWVEEPSGRRRMADPVRTAAVRAVIVVSLTLIQAMMAFLFSLTDSWLAFPTVLTSVAGTVVATWAVLDVWVTRQVWKQRHGVVSVPSSTARRMRRERRRAERAARREGRIAGGGPVPSPEACGRVPDGGAGRLSQA
ncbi:MULTISPECIES: hypothetical protein [unclassified Streptomyces]|uniref:hypothetical protein n=1 Tax=unclassified Streptomyces TaxID=2593676 RepID=UPI0037FD3ED9